MNAEGAYTFVWTSTRMSMWWSHQGATMYRPEPGPVSVHTCSQRSRTRPQEDHRLSPQPQTCNHKRHTYLAWSGRTKRTETHNQNFPTTLNVLTRWLFWTLCLRARRLHLKQLRQYLRSWFEGEENPALTTATVRKYMQPQHILICLSYLMSKERGGHTLRLPAFWWWPIQQRRKQLMPSVQLEIRFQRSFYI